MAQEVISSAILIIAAIIATVALVNAVYPSLFTTTDSVQSVSDTASDRLKTDVNVDMASMQNATTLFLWAKNVGSIKVPAGKLPYTDLYFGEPGSMAMVERSETAAFRWAYVLDDMDGNGDWDPGEILQIAITDAGASHLTTGTHDLQLVLYNSASIKNTITI
ncbi:MAG: hypothetical protein A4E28_01845 [Methanocella sp. PtaU1.Bin125]|nr:MAG: hypothetical protein A4E28_01845 [Methanocella sp. PtaU1.Bin125]